MTEPRAAKSNLPPSSSLPQRGPVSWRSVTLGMLGVAVINLVTAYNDYVLWNTFLVGNSLPLGSLTITFAIVLANGLVHARRPELALSSGEIALAFAMMLVGGSMPGSALMRYLPPSLVYPVAEAGTNSELRRVLQTMNLPDWLYPVLQGDTFAEKSSDPVITGFTGRFVDPDRYPPYLAWLRPLLAWGLFYVFFHAALLCLLTLVRRQWFENERLTFPIAQIQAALVETPPPGKRLAGIMRSRWFWVVFIAVAMLHTLNGLSRYYPESFPEIPVGYRLAPVFSERPWSYLGGHLKNADIFLTAVGVASLLPGAVSFSLWFFVVLGGFVQMQLGTFTGDATLHGLADQHFGGMLAYAGIVLWIGRKHWALILRQAFRGERPGEPRGRYLSYRAAFWIFVGCWLGMIGWLNAAGSTVGGAVLVTSLLLLGIMLIARVVAETGLLHPGETLPLVRPWQVLSYYGFGHAVPTQSFWLGSHLHLIHHDGRESFGVYASHALKLTDRAVFDNRTLEQQRDGDRRLGRRLIALFAAVLVVAFVLGFASMVFVEYRFAMEKHSLNPEPVNRYVAGGAPRGKLVDPTIQYDTQSYNYAHDPGTHLAAGAAGTIFLSWMRLTFAWWPLHPIGYLFMGTWPMSKLWFSILIGWLLRTLVLRFGGASLYTAMRAPMFGLILGEAAVSAVWLIVSVVLSSLGMDYRPMRFALE